MRRDRSAIIELSLCGALLAFAAPGCLSTDEIDWGDGRAETGDPGGDGPGGDQPGGKGDGVDLPGEENTETQQQGLGYQVSLTDIMILAKNAGLPCERLVMAGAVAMAESEGWTGATHWNAASGDCPYGSTDRGIWQINDCYWTTVDDACAFDPACNAEAMAMISENGASFHLWSSVIPDNTYVNFLDEAEAAFDGVPGCGDGSGDPGDGGGDPGDGGGGTATCDQIGYVGVCVDEVSIWAEDGACRVRDCGGEGKHCGFISPQVGYGCLEGTAGSTAFDCGDLGYDGACYADVLVWADGGECHWADCAAQGQSCAWVGAPIGNDCD